VPFLIREIEIELHVKKKTITLAIAAFIQPSACQPASLPNRPASERADPQLVCCLSPGHAVNGGGDRRALIWAGGGCCRAWVLPSE
jgi:hypothetical protein